MCVNERGLSALEAPAIIAQMHTGATIAIDGPVASGKTVVGRLLAQQLGLKFLDTGVMYRAVTWAALRREVPLDDAEALAGLARELSIELVPAPGEEQVRVDEQDVTDALRGVDVEGAVSLVAQAPGVREALVAKQRALAQGGAIVMVGRDIGTVVLPQATVKVFLQASISERARRRYEELRAEGKSVDYQAVEQEMERRDRLDTERAHSPLRPAPDALQVDTDKVPVEEVVEQIMALVEG